MESHLVTLLRRNPLFGDLPAPTRARVAAATQECRYSRGVVVLQKGARPTGLVVVVSGKLKESCRSPGGEEKVVEILGAGHTCGESALFLDSPYPMCASALTNVVLLHVEKRVLAEIIDDTPKFAVRLLQVLAERQNAILRDIHADARSSPLQRVVGYLLEQCRADGADTRNIILSAAKQVIASRLSMTPEALSRTFRDLADAGLIEMSGKRVKLLDADRLGEFARLP
ncbi:MAG: Crp/Fnr family transcriptional regulator [Rhodocyclaceae bacterium]|nr:Crp/Fnr family transcriptional regulator [Rhodocyclaceae bacterium]